LWKRSTNITWPTCSFSYTYCFLALHFFFFLCILLVSLISLALFLFFFHPLIIQIMCSHKLHELNPNKSAYASAQQTQSFVNTLPSFLLCASLTQSNLVTEGSMKRWQGDQQGAVQGDLQI
jgi:hypothetical protein